MEEQFGLSLNWNSWILFFLNGQLSILKFFSYEVNSFNISSIHPPKVPFDALFGGLEMPTKLTIVVGVPQDFF